MNGAHRRFASSCLASTIVARRSTSWIAGHLMDLFIQFVVNRRTGQPRQGKSLIQKYMDCPDSWREKIYFWFTRVNDQKKERHTQDPYYVSHSSKTYDADQQPEDYANVKLYTTRLCVYRT